MQVFFTVIGCIISCLTLAQGSLQWVISEKVTHYGQTVTLRCLSNSCNIENCKYRAGWDRYDPDRMLTFAVTMNQTVPATNKYFGQFVEDGFTLEIRNLSKRDINISYECSVSFNKSEAKYLTEQDVFKDTIKDNDKQERNRLSERQILGIFFGVLTTIIMIIVLLISKRNRRLCFSSSLERQEDHTVTEKLLTAADQRKTENENLPEEADQRKTENENLPEEANQRKTENENLPEEADQRKTENENLPEEADQRKTENENLPEEADQRKTENENLPEEADQRKTENENLPEDNFSIMDVLKVARNVAKGIAVLDDEQLKETEKTARKIAEPVVGDEKMKQIEKAARKVAKAVVDDEKLKETENVVSGHRETSA